MHLSIQFDEWGFKDTIKFLALVKFLGAFLLRDYVVSTPKWNSFTQCCLTLLRHVDFYLNHTSVSNTVAYLKTFKIVVICKSGKRGPTFSAHEWHKVSLSILCVWWTRVTHTEGRGQQWLAWGYKRPMATYSKASAIEKRVL